MNGGTEFYIVDRVPEQTGKLLVKLLIGNGGFVTAKVVAGLPGAGYWRYIDHSHRKFAVTGIVRSTQI